MNRRHRFLTVTMSSLIMTLALLPARALGGAPDPAVATSSPVRLAATHRHAKTLRDEPDLRSSSVLILDTTHSAVLFSRRADVAMPIASITKLMTALVVLGAEQSLDEQIEITREDNLGGRGSYSRLTVGTTLSRGDLIHLALMSSENRAARALGRHYPGGLPACVAAMNAHARALGMAHAHF